MTDAYAAWKHAEDAVTERPEIQRARRHSLEAGIEPVSAATGAQLAQLAAAIDARQILEVGTGCGVASLWLLTGAPEALLTTIDLEPEYQQAAREAFAASGIPSSRTRLIGGRAAEVLPRMNDGSYDLVLVDADPKSVAENVEHALRVVRPGGTVAVARALWHGRVADPTARDETTLAYRSVLDAMLESDAVTSVLSPIGDGLLLLTRRR